MFFLAEIAHKCSKDDNLFLDINIPPYSNGLSTKGKKFSFLFSICDI